MGTGELVLLSKIGGREKLDLLAGMRLHHWQSSDNPNLDARLLWYTEDYTAKAEKAVATPFKLEQCVRIAESQLNGAQSLSPHEPVFPVRVN